jgi:hypothetical protein
MVALSIALRRKHGIRHEKETGLAWGRAVVGSLVMAPVVGWVHTRGIGLLEGYGIGRIPVEIVGLTASVVAGALTYSGVAWFLMRGEIRELLGRGRVSEKGD